MAKEVYCGVSGVARKTNRIYYGSSGVARDVVQGYTGVNSVARQFWDPLSSIKQVIFKATNYFKGTATSEGITNVTSATQAEFTSHGGTLTVNTSNKYIQVQAATVGKAVCITGSPYILLNNGVELSWSDYIYLFGNNTNHITFNITFYAYMPSGSYRYYSTFFKTTVTTSNGNSTTKTISAPTSGQFDVGGGAYSGSGVLTTKLTFNSCTINGTSIPISVANIAK